MTTQAFLLEPRDPAIFRDGKPFSLGLGARTLPFCSPSVTAGALRSYLAAKRGFGTDVLAKLLDIPQVGPFLACQNKQLNWELAFAPPADCVIYDDIATDKLDLYPLRPSLAARANTITDIGEDIHLLLGGKECKPSKKAPAFWTASKTLSWLANTSVDNRPEIAADLGYAPLQRNRRVHVRIDNSTQVAMDSYLFTTEGLEFSGPNGRNAIYSEFAYNTGDWANPQTLEPLGGERRLAFVTPIQSLLPAKPVTLKTVKFLRLQLVTPAIFSNGWLPGWLNEKLTGTPPGSTVELKLKAAAIGRSQPYSGWDLQSKKAKPSHFMVPAGSVYFFEILNDADPSDLWLTALSDQSQARLDGFGIALCGEWQWR